MHDWSKFSPTEFWESARYFSGTRSPIVACREARGYSLAWLHHKGRNPHHYEYWLDYLDEKGTPIAPPFKIALEMICDTIAASRVYNGERFSYDVLLDWWRRRNERSPMNMHPETKRFAETMYETMAADGDCRALRRAREIFDAAKKEK